MQKNNSHFVFLAEIEVAQNISILTQKSHNKVINCITFHRINIFTLRVQKEFKTYFKRLKCINIFI